MRRIRQGFLLNVTNFFFFFSCFHIAFRGCILYPYVYLFIYLYFILESGMYVRDSMLYIMYKDKYIESLCVYIKRHTDFLIADCIRFFTIAFRAIERVFLIILEVMKYFKNKSYVIVVVVFFGLAWNFFYTNSRYQ